MQLILITRSDKPHVSIRLMGWRLWVAVGIIVAVILLAIRIGMAINTESGSLTKSVIDWWEETREDSLAKELGGRMAEPARAARHQNTFAVQAEIKAHR